MKLEELRNRFRSIRQRPPKRRCTRCGKKALYVASSADGMEWFECGNHSETDNVPATLRVSLALIDELWKKVDDSGGDDPAYQPRMMGEFLVGHQDQILGIDFW
jgi:hypothetical protein